MAVWWHHFTLAHPFVFAYCIPKSKQYTKLAICMRATDRIMWNEIIIYGKWKFRHKKKNGKMWKKRTRARKWHQNDRSFNSNWRSAAWGDEIECWNNITMIEKTQANNWVLPNRLTMETARRSQIISGWNVFTQSVCVGRWYFREKLRKRNSLGFHLMHFHIVRIVVNGEFSTANWCVSEYEESVISF